MHVVNALAGGAGVAAFFMLCRRSGATRPMSLLGAFALATAADFWANAAGVEVYTLATAAAFAALYVAVRAPSPGAKGAALAGAAFAGAALFHQLNLLLAPVGLLIYLAAGPGRGRRVLAFAAGYAAVMAIGYVLVPAAFLQLGSAGAYGDWFFHFYRMNRWGAFAAGNLAAAAEAFRSVFYADAFWDNVTAPFAKADPRHLRVALPLWLVVVFGAANLALWLAGGPRRRALVTLGVPFLLYTAFILWWLPGYVSYWLVPAACLVGGVAVAASGRGRRWYVVSLVALALGWLGMANANWRDGIKPRTRLQASPDYRAATALAGFVPPEALTYLAPTAALPHARYFGGLTNARAPSWAVNRFGGDGKKAARRLARLIQQEWDRGRPVYVGDLAFRGLGGPPMRELGEHLLARGRPVGSYTGASLSETVYVVPPGGPASK
jgi:hypothetical protein